jgi:hypothetical protein
MRKATRRLARPSRMEGEIDMSGSCGENRNEWRKEREKVIAGWLAKGNLSFACTYGFLCGATSQSSPRKNHHAIRKGFYGKEFEVYLTRGKLKLVILEQLLSRLQTARLSHQDLSISSPPKV